MNQGASLQMFAVTGDLRRGRDGMHAHCVLTGLYTNLYTDYRSISLLTSVTVEVNVSENFHSDLGISHLTL